MEKEKTPSEPSEIILRRTNSCESDKLYVLLIYLNHFSLKSKLESNSLLSSYLITLLFTFQILGLHLELKKKHLKCVLSIN